MIDLPHFAGRIDPQRVALAGIADGMHRLSRGDRRRSEAQRLSAARHALDLNERQIGFLIARNDPTANTELPRPLPEQR